MTRILVVYGTTHGHTRKVAMELSLALRRAGAATDVFAASPDAPGPEEYAAVIVAASLHARKCQPLVQRWIRRHAEQLRDKPAAFVCVCLAAVEKGDNAKVKLLGVLRELVESYGWSPAYLKPVAGALPYTQYNWFTRWIMKRIVAKKGGDTDTTRDYVYTDWADLSAFAREFLVACDLMPRGRTVVA